MKKLEVLLTPAEIGAPAVSGPDGKVCVVFDVLCATSTMVTALHHGAAGILPVSAIAEALGLHARHPGSRLAGERDGVRIRSRLTGSIDFHFGNSPREFTPGAVQGRTIVMTTSNGTRALRACAGASEILVCSFLNLRSTAAHLITMDPGELLLVCSGHGGSVAYEDVLCAGALVEQLMPLGSSVANSDSAVLARRLFQVEAPNLAGAFASTSSGRMLLNLPGLCEDIVFCARQDCFALVAAMNNEGKIVAL